MASCTNDHGKIFVATLVILEVQQVKLLSPVFLSLDSHFLSLSNHLSHDYAIKYCDIILRMIFFHEVGWYYLPREQYFYFPFEKYEFNEN